MRRRLSLFLLPLLVACGQSGGTAIEQGDPLHKDGIDLPPPVQWTPPAEGTHEPEMISVPAPPFSSGIFPCSRCHIGGKPEPDAAPFLPHKRHLDAELVCADCHDPDETGTPTIPAAEVCFECHENLEEENEAVRKYFDRVRTAEKSYSFPRRWKTRDLVANHRGHAALKVDCASCHGAATDAPFAKPKAVPLMQACMDCHRKRQASLECKVCHTRPPEPRHGIVLHHAEKQRGCLDCHSDEDRDVLHLVNGTKVGFTESYRLCGQCHGPKLRDWKAGLHGKRTGMWDGRKEYLLCVHCHLDPHQPAFKPMQPDPPPPRPEDVK